MKETIPQYLEMHGYRGRVVSIRHLRALQEEIQDRYERGLLDEDLYQTYLARFSYQPPRSYDRSDIMMIAENLVFLTRFLAGRRHRNLPFSCDRRLRYGTTIHFIASRFPVCTR